MPLEPGTPLGPYEVVAPIGAGGMGEVYEARDTRLDRRVAIKVLPDHLSDSDELRQRFEQEARAVSSLNHPHICTLHDIGRENGVDFMVMELLEGETLADRLERGALSVEDALELARQIADALDEAHRRDIVHRDSKPGNTFLTKSGVKLLDFGLAKLHERKEVAETSSVLTQQKPLTQQGAILGTFQYMAPEQLEGKSVDARTDLFAFGAVLYEMITGRRAFEGESQASLIGAILHTDPPAVSELRPMAPASLDRLVRKCLAKTPDDRWQTARDLKDELGWVAESGDRDVPVTRTASVAPKLAAAALGGALVAALAVSLLARSPDVPAEVVTRSVIELPQGERLPRGSGPNIALSPDGTLLAFRTRHNLPGPLFLHRMNELDSVRVADVDAGPRLFFSSDGQWVSFVKGADIRKVSIRDGTEVVVSEGNIQGTPFDWAFDGRIVASALEGDGLVLIPSEGEPPLQLTSVDRDNGEEIHLFPQVLPGGAVLFTVFMGGDRFEDNRISVVSPETGEIRVIQEGGTFARYAPTGGDGEPGHLLFARPGVLFAAPFDPETLTLLGTAVPVLTDVWTMGGGMMEMTFTRDGTLVYAPGTYTIYERQLIEIDRDGNETVILDEPLGYGAPAYSPDGNRLAITIETEAEANIAVYDFERGSLTPITFEGRNIQAVWSPDGSRVAFASDRDGAFSLYVRSADGSGVVERLTTSETVHVPFSWSRDGRHIAFTAGSDRQQDIWVISMDDGTSEPFIASEFFEGDAAFSPDGQWLAYYTDQTGDFEVWARSFPDGAAQRVSIEGGTGPVWSPSGDVLYLQNSDERLMEVRPFQNERPAIVAESVTIPWTFSHHTFTFLRDYDVSPDGTRFVTTKVADAPDRLHLVTNWFAELRELAPRDAH